MKKFKTLVALFVISILIYSCSTEEEQEFEPLQKDTSELNGRSSTTAGRNYSANSLVIRFASGVSELDKQFLRRFYRVRNYKLCSHCSDQSIELWFFDDSIDIEPKKTTIDNPSGGLGYPTNYLRYIESVDFNFDIKVATTNSNLNTNLTTDTFETYQSYIKNSNEGLTIAVFDTGINPDAGGDTPIFQDQFLYNASNDGIPSIYSGWDFVNQDDNCFDDNPGLHGTAVSSIITGILNDYHIPHQIMPLKICNADGKTSYFNLLCSLNYALERRADILQMSLGWYDNNSGDLVNNIFLDLMNEHPNTIIVCSAGNDNFDNDIKIHCPSGYSLDNIIAIASCNVMGSNISGWSNYGKNKVDFFACGEEINFLGSNIEGTSFAAPKVAAIVARLKYNNPNISIDELIVALETFGIPCEDIFDPNKRIKYNKILIP